MPDGLPKSAQVVPPSIVYCQAPLALSTPVTAIPLATPPGPSSVVWVAMSADTSVPASATGSSDRLVSVLAPVSTGAMLVATNCGPNSEVSLSVSVAVAVSRDPVVSPGTGSEPLNDPWALVVTVPR